MENNKVLCPYCGTEMRPTEPHLHTTRSGVGILLQCHFYCPDCYSSAPWVDDNYKSDKECIEEAYKVAITRAN